MTIKMRKILYLVFSMLVMMACSKGNKDIKVVVCVPVYGQSLALGEEAELLTDIGHLYDDSQGRIMAEGLGSSFGYYEDHGLKQMVKRLIRYSNRLNENSSYAMAKTLTEQLGKDTAVCIFAGGRGGTEISRLVKGSEPYTMFLENIKKSYEEARERGIKFYVPAICWMQGESDMFDYTHVDYKKMLKQFAEDINNDVKEITRQREDVKIVTYQSCCLTRCWNFDPLQYNCYEATIPQAQMELAREKGLFAAGTPVYPFSFVDERIHLDGKSQQEVGRRHAFVVLDIIRKGESSAGLYPTLIAAHDSIVTVKFNRGPLSIDTTNVSPAKNLGFSVITPDGRDITSRVDVTTDSIVINCNAPATACCIRYAINGTKQKTGGKAGPRGNIKASDGKRDYWCFMFAEKVE